MLTPVKKRRPITHCRRGKEISRHVKINIGNIWSQLTICTLFMISNGSPESLIQPHPL